MEFSLCIYFVPYKVIIPMYAGGFKQYQNSNTEGIYLLGASENSHFRPNLSEDLQQCSATSKYLQKCLSIVQYAVLTGRVMHGHLCMEPWRALSCMAQIIIGWQKNLAFGGGGGKGGGRRVNSRPWSPTGMLLDPNRDCGWDGGGGRGEE